MLGRTPTYAADPLVGLFGEGKRLNPRQEQDEGVPHIARGPAPGVRPT